jgi:hypothetical protein
VWEYIKRARKFVFDVVEYIAGFSEEFQVEEEEIQFSCGRTHSLDFSESLTRPSIGR